MDYHRWQEAAEKELIRLTETSDHLTKELRVSDPEEERRLIFKFGIPPNMPDIYILDFDFALSREFERDKMPELLENLHEFTNDLFQWSLCEEFLEKYKKGVD